MNHQVPVSNACSGSCTTWPASASWPQAHGSVAAVSQKENVLPKAAARAGMPLHALRKLSVKVNRKGGLVVLGSFTAAHLRQRTWQHV